MGQEITFWLRLWVVKNKDRFPRYMALTACGIVCLLGASFTLTALHPAAGEIFQNTLIAAGAFMTVALVALTCICFVAVAANNFGRGIQFEYAAPSGLLAASNYQEPDIYPDVLIALRPGEDRLAFVSRMEQATNGAGEGVWVVVIPYRYPSGMIYETPTRYRDFIRERPPFQSDGWSDAQKVCPDGTYFRDESPAEYRQYLERFAFYFREWASRVKVTGEGEAGRRLEILKVGIKASLNVLLFLLLSLPAFAQNAAAVSEALGTRIREIPAKGDQVQYIFERSEFARIGDGRRDYVALLKGAPMYRDSRGGKFVAVVKNGEVIVRADQAGEVATAMRPNRSEGAPEPAGYSLPDSAGMADMAERVKYEMWKAKEMAVDSAEPWWGVVMYAFWMIIPFLFLLGGASWLWAKVCATEGMYTMHKAARRLFAILSLSAATVLLANVMIAAIIAGVHPFLLFLLAIAECALANWVVSWLIPDFRPAAGNYPARNYHDNSQPPLLG